MQHCILHTWLASEVNLIAVADKLKWCVYSGNAVSLTEVLPSIERRNARFFCASNVARIDSCLAYSRDVEVALQTIVRLS